jgi:protein gp37
MRKPHEWWDATWNPITGCTRVSAGCDRCYAHELHDRFGDAIHGGEFGTLRLHEDRLTIPCRWRKPRTVFLGSMTDMLHEQVLPKWWDRVFEVVFQEHRHQYVLLTKRPERLAELVTYLVANWPEHITESHFCDRLNLWLGVSVEDQATANQRLPLLVNWAWPISRCIVSVEPWLAPLTLHVDIGHGVGDLAIDRLAGVIAGAETGPRARPANRDWFRVLDYECRLNKTPFFLKQINAKRERVLDGRTHDALPWEAGGLTNVADAM